MADPIAGHEGPFVRFSGPSPRRVEPLVSLPYAQAGGFIGYGGGSVRCGCGIACRQTFFLTSEGAYLQDVSGEIYQGPHREGCCVGVAARNPGPVGVPCAFGCRSVSVLVAGDALITGVVPTERHLSVVGDGSEVLYVRQSSSGYDQAAGLWPRLVVAQRPDLKGVAQVFDQSRQGVERGGGFAARNVGPVGVPLVVRRVPVAVLVSGERAVGWV